MRAVRKRNRRVSAESGLAAVSAKRKQSAILLTPAQVGRLLSCAKESGARDHALLALAYNAGLHLSEVVRLKEANHVASPPWLFPTIDPGGQLWIARKGKPLTPWDQLFLPPALNEMLGEYIRATRDARKSPYLFPSRNAKRAAPITTRAAQLMFGRMVARAKLDSRASFASLRTSLRASLWAAGADVHLVCARMRDRDLDYTKRTRQVESKRVALADPVRTVVL